MVHRLLQAAAVMAVFAGAAFSQQPTGADFAPIPLVMPVDKLPEFEVADIQVSKTPGQPQARFMPGGKIQFTGLPMKFMILAAWGWENDESRVTGGPGWMGSESYDIVAKAGHDSPIPQLRLMLRSLLYKRFGLEMHLEDRQTPVYALVKGKGEPKVKPSAAAGEMNCKRSSDNGVVSADCHNMTMEALANAMRGFAPAYVDKPVVNLTEMKGEYDLKFEWTPRGQLLGVNGGRGGAPTDGKVIDLSETAGGGRTFFEGVDKFLGLRLESVKHAIPVVVVDKVNRTPTEN
jgi:uncharacterized protein (TIGR03435 family)